MLLTQSPLFVILFGMKSPQQKKNKRIDLQTKSGLARLMAIENLHVVHSPQARTASMDLVNRVVTLPILKDMSNHIYDWFIAHEISHALYTPADATKNALKTHKDLPFEYLNITEDARIEKLIKRKYPGTARDSLEFYKDLSSPEKDFFSFHKIQAQGIDAKNIPFIDRVNLHFKIGKLYNIPINNDTEKALIKQTGDAETFEEALQAALDIYDYVKQNQMQEESLCSNESDNEDSDNEDENDENNNASSSEDDNESDSDESNSNSSDDKSEQEETQSNSSDGDGDEETSEENSEPSDDGEGADASEQQQQPDISDDNERSDCKPDERLSEGFSQNDFDDNFENNEVVDEFDDDYCFGDISQPKDMTDFFDRHVKSYKNTFSTVLSEQSRCGANYKSNYSNFLAKVTPTINMMVSQFNMRKSALEYQKLQESETGILNMKKIAKYQITDDIFLKNEIIPEAQSHGMVMLLDWSYSMTSHIESTVKQLFVLMEFCKKVSIPFEVYAFTSSNAYRSSAICEYVEHGEIYTCNSSKIIHLFSSNERMTLFREHCARVKGLIDNDLEDSIYSMSGTPMYDAILKSEHLIKAFQDQHKVQKTILCVLADGDPNDSIMQNRYLAKNVVTMRDRYSAKNYTFKQSDRETYHHLLHYIKDRCSLDSVMGFYLTAKTTHLELENFAPDVDFNSHAKLKEFHKNSYCELPASIAFDNYFVVSVDNFKFNSSKTDVIGKSNSMIFMKKFIEQIS